MKLVYSLALATVVGLTLPLTLAPAALAASPVVGTKAVGAAPSGIVLAKLVCPPGSGKPECGYDVDPYTKKKTKSCYCGHGRRPIKR